MTGSTRSPHFNADSRCALLHLCHLPFCHTNALTQSHALGLELNFYCFYFRLSSPEFLPCPVAGIVCLVVPPSSPVSSRFHCPMHATPTHTKIPPPTSVAEPMKVSAICCASINFMSMFPPSSRSSSGVLRRSSARLLFENFQPWFAFHSVFPSRNSVP